MATIEERVSRLEGGYEHLATKADVYRAIADVRSDLNRAMLTLGIFMTGLVGAAVAFLKLTS